MDGTIILQARAAIGGLTPLHQDCGALCEAACCRPDADGQGGVYLFPGEESLFRGADWMRIEPSPFAPVLICEGTCDRERRPLGCRIFPLTPVRGEKGWTVRVDARARAMCPLARSGIRGLDPAFVRAVRRAIRIIAADSSGEAFLDRWAELESEYRFEL